MREVKRLDGFYNYLKTVHKHFFPDWRFGQLVSNIIRYYGDIFYLEEDEFLKVLSKFVKDTRGEKNVKR